MSLTANQPRPAASVSMLPLISLSILATVIFPASVAGQASTAGSDDSARAPSIEERLSDPVYMAWAGQEKVRQCVICHYSGPNPLEALAGEKKGGKLTAFSRRQELELWLNRDKHTIARRRVEPFEYESVKSELIALMEKLDKVANGAADTLEDQGFRIDRERLGLKEFPKEWIGKSNFLSRRICDKLWQETPVTTAAGYAKFRDNCLTCHGGYQSGDKGFDFKGKGEAQIGIDCKHCHQIEENTDWVDAHWKDADDHEKNVWRLKSPDEKATAGMRHLVGVSGQANLCFDCHIGNRQKGMFVTHEMYAAGHPPLPSVELQTFCREMPQHWQTPKQLYRSLANYEGRDQYFETNYPGVNEKVAVADTLWQTRKMLIGVLAAQIKTLDLLIDSHDPAKPELWADYSLYDCAACHHELRIHSKRQARPYPGAPGRPRRVEWPDALFEVAALFGGHRQLVPDLAQLHAVIAQQPFGDADQVARTARKLRADLVRAQQHAERAPLSKPQARQALQFIARISAEKLMTYDSSRQVIWAMNVIASELGDDLDAQVRDAISDLADASDIHTKLPASRGQLYLSGRAEGGFGKACSVCVRHARRKADGNRRPDGKCPRELGWVTRPPVTS